MVEIDIKINFMDKRESVSVGSVHGDESAARNYLIFLSNLLDPRTNLDSRMIFDNVNEEYVINHKSKIKLTGITRLSQEKKAHG